MEPAENKPFGQIVSETAHEMAEKIAKSVDMQRIATDRDYILQLQESFLKGLILEHLRQIDKDDLVVQAYFQIALEATPQLDAFEFCAGVCLENMGGWEVSEHNLTRICDMSINNPFHKWWYYEAIEIGVGGWTRVYYDPYMKKNVISYSVPAYSAENLLVGVLGIDIDYDDFKSIMEKRLMSHIRRDIEIIQKEHQMIGESASVANKYLDMRNLGIISGDGGEDGFTARSPEMEATIELAMRAATSDANVLLQGETGAGKDYIANYIHNKSNFSGGPLINVNCCSLPENLMEAEFFGYGRGAFTGAEKEGKAGYFEAADGGTIVLNEIGDLPLHLQTKFLNVIQEKAVTRLSETKKRKTNFRLIAITNKDLFAMVCENKFREDLFYRLNVLAINVPPLRRRKEDIPVLANLFLQRFVDKYNVDREFSSEVMSSFLSYSWPGNIREMENIIERLVLTSRQKNIAQADFPPEFSERMRRFGTAPMDKQHPGLQDSMKCSPGKREKPLKKEVRNLVEDLEAEVFRAKYEELGSSYKVAKELGISQSQAYQKIRKYVLKNK